MASPARALYLDSCRTTTSKANDFINRFKTARLHAEETEDSSEEGPDVCCFRVRSTQVVVGRAMQMGLVWFCALLLRGGWDKVASYTVWCVVVRGGSFCFGVRDLNGLSAKFVKQILRHSSFCVRVRSVG